MRLLLGLLALLASCTAGSTADVAMPNATPAGPPVPAPVATAVPTPTPVRISWPPIPANARRAHVVGVVDGDTIALTGVDVGSVYRDGRPGRRARLIGVDTPEMYGNAGCYGAQASAFTRRELASRDVLVGFDVGPLDRYGRALVYVWKPDGTFFNGLLVREGYAIPATVPPNVKYANLFVNFAREARLSGRGLWSAC